jgi:hypothetical protein
MLGVGLIKEVVKFKEVLDLYYRAIGMEVNAHKYFILFNGLGDVLER